MSPFRRPQWRADRARLLADHRPQPLPARSSDDRYVRAYRQLLILHRAASGDPTMQFSAFARQPHAQLADRIYFWPDREFRHILEARLLAGEAFCDVAFRCGMNEKTVDHYAALFFDVFDRLDNLEDTTWIDGVILDRNYPPTSRLNGAISEEQRGFLYRLFGFYGGSDVLDVVIRSLGPATMPEPRDAVVEWLKDAARQIVQSWTTKAAKYPLLKSDNVLELLDQAVSTATPPGKLPVSDFEFLVTRIIAGLGGNQLRAQGKLAHSP